MQQKFDSKPAFLDVFKQVLYKKLLKNKKKFLENKKKSEFDHKNHKFYH